MRRTAELDNYNRGKWRYVIFVAGAKAGEHLKIKVAEVGNWFDNAQAVSRSPEGKREKEG
jgi:predicted RNA-binding protein with TRAM domain